VSRLSAAELIVVPSPGVRVGPVSFVLSPGDLLVLRGPNGCGKTTLLRTLAGLHPVESGQLSAPSAVAYVAQGPQDEEQVPLGVDEVLGLMQARTGSAKSRADERRTVLVGVGLDGRGERRLSTLSGGERQRVRFAAALLSTAPLLLFDEATSAVDDEGERRLADLLGTYLSTTGRMAVVVTHRPDAWTKSSTATVVLPDPSRGHR
jgi:ABC-type Mn2+/Zn2+ transport system ATPase subunit